MNMSRFLPYLIIIAALAIGASAVILSSNALVLDVPVNSIAISNISTTSAVSNAEEATSTLEIFVPAEVTSSEKVAQPKVAPAPTPEPVVSAQPVAESISVTNAQLDASASLLRNALVNIICYVPAGSGLHSMSASGVFVDPKGIILTNAHVAQYFLLADRSVSCTIRSGSPAIDRYNAELIFISPTWIQSNTTVLTETLPNGTGEYDFAFLAVSKSATRNPLPVLFPYIPLATTPPTAGTPIVIASYGAQFLETSQVQSSLFPTIVFGSVKDVFTFGTNTIDVLALGGSAAAQEGSSGGGVADAFGNLVGTITTSTVLGSTDTRSLGAITSSYIRAEYANETGQALDILLDKPTAVSINNFASQIPALKSILAAHLP